MSPLSALVPLLLVGALVVCVAWVLRDARAHTVAGRPVVVRFGTVQIEQPEVWAGACLLVWVLFFPLYLKARSES